MSSVNGVAGGGGVLSRGVGIEWSEDGARVVPIVFDDHGGLDSLEARVLEAVKVPGGVSALIAEIVEERVWEGRREAIERYHAEVMASRNKELTFFQIAFAVNLTFGRCASMAAIAAEFGISKQAMEQGVERHRLRLGLGRARPMRSEAARERMRLRNCRPGNLMGKGSGK